MNPEQLKAELKLADSKAEESFRSLVGVRQGTSERRILDQHYDSCLKSSADLRRQLAILTGDEHAIRLSVGIRPECAVSGPVLIHTDRHCLLLFNARSNTVDSQMQQGAALEWPTKKNP